MVALVPFTPVPVHQKQWEALSSTAWLTGFCAGRGCGKTTVGPHWIHRQSQDGDQFMAASPTYPMLEETTFPVFRDVMKDMGCFVRDRSRPFRMWYRTLDGGTAECVFRSADNPDSLRGPSKKGLWLDEPSYMPPGVMEAAMAILRFKGQLGRCFMSFTPRGKLHWTFGQFFERNDGTDLQLARLVEELETFAKDATKFAEFQHARRRIEAFHAGAHIPKYDTFLVSATTLDNPFLHESFYDRMRGVYTEAMAQQELGGEFVDLEGQMFSRHWFAIVEAVPRDCIWVRYWDKGGTEGGGCPTVGLLLGYQQASGRIFIVDVQREQLSALKRERLIESTANQDAKEYGMGVVHTFVEQEGGSGGKESMELTIRNLVGHNIRRDIPGSGGLRVKGGERIPGSAKIIRAQPFAAQCEAGNVFLVRGNWNETYREELCAFPESKYADQVDASSGAFNALRTKVLAFYGGATQAAERIQAPENRHGLKLERKKV